MAIFEPDLIHCSRSADLFSKGKSATAEPTVQFCMSLVMAVIASDPEAMRIVQASGRGGEGTGFRSEQGEATPPRPALTFSDVGRETRPRFLLCPGLTSQERGEGPMMFLSGIELLRFSMSKLEEEMHRQMNDHYQDDAQPPE